MYFIVTIKKIRFFQLFELILCNKYVGYLMVVYGKQIQPLDYVLIN